MLITAGTTYFFKNRGYWKFNDGRMSVEHEEPRSIGLPWYNCSEGTTSRRERLQTSAPAAASAATTAYRSTDRLLAMILTLAIVCLLQRGTSNPPPSSSGGCLSSQRTSPTFYGGTTSRFCSPWGRGPVHTAPCRGMTL